MADNKAALIRVLQKQSMVYPQICFEGSNLGWKAIYTHQGDVYSSPVMGRKKDAELELCSQLLRVFKTTPRKITILTGIHLVVIDLENVPSMATDLDEIEFSRQINQCGICPPDKTVCIIGYSRIGMPQANLTGKFIAKNYSISGSNALDFAICMHASSICAVWTQFHPVNLWIVTKDKFSNVAKTVLESDFGSLLSVRSARDMEDLLHIGSESGFFV